MSEEVEVLSDSEDADFWATYQSFFLNSDAVEVTEDLINIEVHAPVYHDLVSDGDLEFPFLSVRSAYHILESPEVRVEPEGVIIAAYTEHEHVAEEPTILVKATAVVDSAYHTVYSSIPELSAGLVLKVDDAYHEHAVAELTLAVKGTVDVADTSHLLTDTGMNDVYLIYQYSIDADDSYHTTQADKDLVIGIDGNTVYPRDCEHSVGSTEPGTLTFKALISPAAGYHVHIAEEIDDLVITFNIEVDDSSHVLWSENASPDYIYADSCSHVMTSDNVWAWVDNAFHAVVSPQIAITSHIIPDDSTISFTPLGDVALVVGINPADCYHSLFTKDEIVPADCYHEIEDDFVSNTRYRRLYV